MFYFLIKAKNSHARGMNEDFGLEQVLYGIMFSDIFNSFQEAHDEIMLMFERLVFHLRETCYVKIR